MAFGTGEHTTTATCLRLLADVAGTLPANFAALDLGTGAGILAIAAKALGAGRVAAVDFDRVAVRIAKQNASTNGFSTIEISQGDVLRLAVRKPFDVVLANLFSDVLVQAAPRIARATRPGGWLVFSGVLRDQVRQVANAFVAAGFTNPRIVLHGKWCAGTCQRKQPLLVHPSGRGSLEVKLGEPKNLWGSSGHNWADQLKTPPSVLRKDARNAWQSCRGRLVARFAIPIDRGKRGDLIRIRSEYRLTLTC